MTDWECQFCHALNEDKKHACWNCKKDRTLSDAIFLERNGASIAEREAAAATRKAVDDRVKEAKEAATRLSDAGNLDLRGLLALHAGLTVGMNANDPTKVIAVTLVSVQADHFTVEVEGRLVRTPYSQILRVTEGADGGTVKASVFGESFDLIVEIFHMVVYKGAVGMGISIPI